MEKGTLKRYSECFFVFLTNVWIILAVLFVKFESLTIDVKMVYLIVLVMDIVILLQLIKNIRGEKQNV